MKKWILLIAVIVITLAMYQECTRGPYFDSSCYEDNVIYVDYGKPEFSRRLTFNDTHYHCASGSGKGFSNKPGSHCSSLGHFNVIGRKRMSNGYPALVLEGTDSTNSNARSRGILIHPSYTVDLWTWYLWFKTDKTSEGCFSVSHECFDAIDREFQKHGRLELYATKD